MKLLYATSNEWISTALNNFDALLIDHAHCEKKAAANALSILQMYPDIERLPSHMARLAREESAHLARVLEELEKRGLQLTKDKGDPYVKALHALIRHPFSQRRIDRLLIAGIVEARSHERLQLIAENIKDPQLADLYSELAQSEDGHQRLFEQLAHKVADDTDVDARLNVLLEHEAHIVRTLPIRAAIH